MNISTLKETFGNSIFVAKYSDFYIPLFKSTKKKFDVAN